MAPGLSPRPDQYALRGLQERFAAQRRGIVAWAPETNRRASAGASLPGLNRPRHKRLEGSQDEFFRTVLA